MKFQTAERAVRFARERDRILGYPKVTAINRYETAAPVIRDGNQWITASCGATLKANGFFSLNIGDGVVDDIIELDDDQTLPAHTQSIKLFEYTP